MIQWSAYEHDHFDGVGGAYYYLNKNFLFTGKIEEIKSKRRPAPLRLISTFLKQLVLSILIRPKWSLKIKNVHGDPACIASYTFTAEEFNNMKKDAFAAGVSLNTFLLKKLDLSTRDGLVEAYPTTIWVVPVNMRGAQGVNPNVGNQTSSLIIHVNKNDSLLSLHQKIKDGFLRGDHFCGWLFSHLSKFVNTNTLRFIHKSFYKSDNYIGSLSNLGSWETMSDQEKTVLFSPPAGRMIPLSAGVIEVNGKLSISLQIHPCISRETETTKRMMCNWIEKLINKNHSDDIEVTTWERLRSKKTSSSVELNQPLRQ